jgi:heat shock protein HtpX
MKRVFLFLATNLAVALVLSIVLNVLGVAGAPYGARINIGALLTYSVIVGFAGAIISLLMSKPMAKWSTGARVINDPTGATELWLIGTVRTLAERAGIAMPEVAIYAGEPNAFATGAFKNSALVAVSTGLLATMERDEVEAVLGHEIAHIANGDMVTLTLIQGVVNTFVVFLARVVGTFVDKVVCKGDADRGPGIGYAITVFVCEITFGLAASLIVAWFSRQREFRADAGSARLLGSTDPMQRALRRLAGMEPGELPRSVAAAGVAGAGGWGALFSSHPPVGERIAALEAM